VVGVCQSRFRREEREERFEEEVRDLFERERERPERPTPVFERDTEEESAAESPAQEAAATRS
jgi:hypothetical protein